MTTIRASCPDCGDVNVEPDDIGLKVCSTYAPASYYEFECPTCSEIVRKPADDRVIQLLISGGVYAMVWEYPSEILEPHPGGPAFTPDDLLDFHLLLEKENWFERFLAA